jgi:hypothetical protein
MRRRGPATLRPRWWSYRLSDALREARLARRLDRQLADEEVQRLITRCAGIDWLRQRQVLLQAGYSRRTAVQRTSRISREVLGCEVPSPLGAE